WKLSELAFPDDEAIDVLVDGNISYVSCYSNKIRVINTTDIFNPVQVNSITLNSMPNSIMKHNDLLFVANGLSGIVILNITNPLNIEQLSSFFDGGNAQEIEIMGDVLYLADGPNGLEIYNIENPYSIQKLLYLAADVIGAFAFDVSVSQELDILTLGYGSLGLIYFDISNPLVPIFENYISYPYSVNGVYSTNDSGKHISWIANGENGISYAYWSGGWFDPQEYASFSNSGYANDFSPYVDGVIVSDSWDGIEYCTYDSFSIELRGYFSDGGTSYNTDNGLIGSNNLIFVADGSDGLEILGEDSDNDFLANIQEEILGTNKTDNDTDGDQFYDGFEIFYNTDPLNATDFPDIEAPPTTLPEIPSPTPTSNNTHITNTVENIGFVFSASIFFVFTLFLTTFKLLSKQKRR
ncbi:MAG: hypothetical protein ACTSQK_12585, partial [Candidatus Heimdallarchaeota archaeon]